MKSIQYALLLILILFTACASNQSKEKIAVKEVHVKERIAVLDLKTVDVTAAKSRVISELIRTELINTNKYIVIERSQVDMIFREHGFSSLGVTDDTSAVKIGKLLTAHKILIGSVMKLGESIVVTARVVDVEKGIAEYSARVTAADDESLVGETASLVDMLTGGGSAESASGAGIKAQAKPAKVMIKTSKKIYAVGEDIIVTYKNFPGTRSDYISIAHENESASKQYTYDYTHKNREGTLTFFRGVDKPGIYEIRAHTNYDKGDVQPTAVIKITVK
jgi:TolB-like protein